MLTLKIVSKNGCLGPVSCDSVHLNLPDDTLGKGGGSMGIRTGHIKSLISVERGRITAYLEGKEIFSCQTDVGFATVENDNVTVVTEGIR